MKNTKKLSGKPQLAAAAETINALIDVAERVIRAEKRGIRLPRGLAKAAREAMEKCNR